MTCESQRSFGLVNNQIYELMDIPEILVLNKIDQISQEEKIRLRHMFPEGILISALTRENLDILVDRISRTLPTKRNFIENKSKY